MSDPSVEGRLLRGFLETILQAQFTPAEARAAAKAVRSQKFLEPLGQVLDAFAGPSGADEKSQVRDVTPSDQPIIEKKVTPSTKGLNSVDALFETVKRRKVTKGNLYELFQQVNIDAAPNPNEDLSIRESLRLFRSLATDADWSLLTALVEGKTEIDPFLRGILSVRR